MGQNKKLRTKLNKDKKQTRTHEQNIKTLEYLRLKEKENGFTEYDRLPGLNNFVSLEKLQNSNKNTILKNELKD